MMDIIRPVAPTRTLKEKSLKDKLAWFALLYLSGLAAVVVFSYGFRFMMMD
jgi:hypothetical protein